MQLNFHMPTKVFMGENCVINNSSCFSKLGKKALIVTGKTSAKQSGALAHIEQALKMQRIDYQIFDQVEPNPSIACVQNGGALAKKMKADFVIGIGGGSPMDAAKAIALLATNPWGEDLFRQSYQSHPLPICAIPTTAGTGSEVTHYAIVTDNINQTKRSIATPDIFPRYAFLDGQYTLNLPTVTTINTVIDAFSHAAEGFLSGRATCMSDCLALESMRIIGENLAKLPNPLSLNNRNQLLYASMLAGIVIAQTGTTIVHGMGYSLTYFLGIDHGRANGLLFASFLDFSKRQQAHKVQAILDCLKLKDLDQFAATFATLLGEREVVTSAQLMDFSARAIKTGNVNNTRPVPNQDDILQMFQSSFN